MEPIEIPFSKIHNISPISLLYNSINILLPALHKCEGTVNIVEPIEIQGGNILFSKIHDISPISSLYNFINISLPALHKCEGTAKMLWISCWNIIDMLPMADIVNMLILPLVVIFSSFPISSFSISSLFQFSNFVCVFSFLDAFETKFMVKKEGGRRGDDHSISGKEVPALEMPKKGTRYGYGRWCQKQGGA